MTGVRVEVVLPPEAMEEIVAEASRRVLASLGEQKAVSSPFVTPTEAAEILACPRQRIYDLASAGRLPRFKESGRTLHRRVDALALIEPERRK